MNFSCCEKFIGSANKLAYLRCRARVSYARQRSGKVPPSTYKKDIDLCQYLFYYEVGSGWNHHFGGFSGFYVRVKSSESERTRVREDKDLRQRSEANHLSERQ